MKLLKALLMMIIFSAATCFAQPLSRPVYLDASGTVKQLADEAGVLSVKLAAPGSGSSDIRIASEGIGLGDSLSSIIQGIATVTEAVNTPLRLLGSGYLVVTSTPAVVISPVENQHTIRITVIDGDIATWPVFVAPGELATIGESIPVWQYLSRDWGPASITLVTSDTAKVYYELGGR